MLDEIRMNSLSFPYVIYACMEEVGFWKGLLSWESCHFLLRVSRGTCHASL